MIRAILLAALLAGCVVSAHPTDWRKVNVGPADWSLVEPPSKYDHEFDGTHDIQYVSLAETKSKCGGIGCSCGGVIGYCLQHNPHYCVSYIATDSVIPAEMIVRHERGHCNGWTDAHEDGHLVPAY